MKQPISTLDQKQFIDLVNSDIRDALNPEEKQELRDPVNLLRWKDALQIMKRDLEYQFSSNKSDRAAKWAEIRHKPHGEQEWAEFLRANENWRVGALKFYRGVERKLNEATRLLSEVNNTTKTNVVNLAGERLELLRRVEQLEKAIRTHRKEIMSEDDGISVNWDPDEKLWETLDNDPVT